MQVSEDVRYDMMSTESGEEVTQQEPYQLLFNHHIYVIFIGSI